MFKLADHLTADDDMHALDNIGLTFIEEYGLFAEKLELFKLSWPNKKRLLSNNLQNS